MHGGDANRLPASLRRPAFEPWVDDPVTELVVTKIVALAKAGEYNPDRLCAQVLAELADRD
jgi:hypothetical protein